jgi:NTP pyrophosphatase (non-canonical NTP hydrolase)
MTDAGIPMGEVLKLCPFCGGEAAIRKVWEAHGSPYQIEVDHSEECPAAGSWFSTKAEALAAWNTRAFADTPPPAAAGDRSRLGEALLSVWKQAEENHREHSDTGDQENDIRFLTLGLTGEAGEVANFVKKRWRDGDGHDEAIRLEIADVCAYAFMLASTMGMSPADLIGTIAHKQAVFVAKMNAKALRTPEPDSGGEGGK